MPWTIIQYQVPVICRILSSLGTSVESSSLANELTRYSDFTAQNPISGNDTVDLKVNSWPGGTFAIMVKNIVFKPPESGIWLSWGLLLIMAVLVAGLYEISLRWIRNYLCNWGVFKSIFDFGALHWEPMSWILEIGFLGVFIVCAIMGDYSNLAIPFWTLNHSKTSCTANDSSGRASKFMIARTSLCSLHHLSESI